jgi:hypothetical protein
MALPLSAATPAGAGLDLSSVPGNAACHHLITEPGIYYLTDDIEVTLPTGINIQAPGVILDLNGFEIRRRDGEGGHGILIALEADNSTVMNGSVTGFAYGVRAFSEGGQYLNLRVSRCLYAGLIAGPRWLIEGCDADDNPEIGIAMGTGSRLVTPFPIIYGSPGARENDSGERLNGRQ